MEILNYKFSYFNVGKNDMYCFNYDNVNNLYIHKDEIILKRQQQSLIDIFNIDKRGIIISKQNLNISNSLLYTLSTNYDTNIKTENESIFNDRIPSQKIDLLYDKLVSKNQRGYKIKSFSEKDIFTKNKKYLFNINDAKFNYTLSNNYSLIKDNGESQSSTASLMGCTGGENGFLFNSEKYYHRMNTNLSDVRFEQNDNIYKKIDRILNIGKENEVSPILNKRNLNSDILDKKIVPLLMQTKKRKLNVDKDLVLRHSEPRGLSIPTKENRYSEKQSFKYVSHIGKEKIPFHKISKIGTDTNYKTNDFNLFAIDRKLHFHKKDELVMPKVKMNVIVNLNELLLQKSINKKLIIEDKYGKPIYLEKDASRQIYSIEQDKYKTTPLIQKIKSKNLMISNERNFAQNSYNKSITITKIYEYKDNSYKFLTKEIIRSGNKSETDIFLKLIKNNKIFKPHRDIQPIVNFSKLNYKMRLDGDILLKMIDKKRYGYIVGEELTNRILDGVIKLSEDKLLKIIDKRKIFTEIGDNLAKNNPRRLFKDINDKLLTINAKYGRALNTSDTDWVLKAIDKRKLKIEDTIVPIQKIGEYDITTLKEKIFAYKQSRQMYDIINTDNQHLYPDFNNKAFDTSSPIFPNTPLLEKISNKNIYDTSDKRYGTTVKVEDLSSIDIYDNADSRYKMENYLNRVQNKIINTNPETDKWYENFKNTLIKVTGFDNYSKHSFKYLIREKFNLLMPIEKDIKLIKNGKNSLAPLEKDKVLNKLTKYSNLIIHTDIVLDTKLNIKRLVSETDYLFEKSKWRELNADKSDELSDKNNTVFRNINTHKDNIVFKKGINKKFNNDFDKTISFDKYHSQKENYIYRDFYIKKNKKHIEMEKPKILQQVDKTLLMEQTQKNIELYNTLWMIRGLGDTDLKILPSADFEYPASIHMFYEKPDFNYYFEYLSLHDIYIDGDYIIELYDIDYNIVSILKINGVKVGTYNNDEIKLTIEEVPLNELEYEKEFTQFKFSIKVTSLNVSFIIVRQPIIPNNNIVLYTVTEKFLADNKHPIPFGSDLGTREIPIHVNIMVEFINVLLLIWQKRFLGFDMHTGMRAIEGLLKIVHQWLTLEPSLEHESIAEYHRCYRWLRWEAEKVYNVAKQDIKLNGNKWIREVILEMIDYLEMHHIEVVPILNEIRDTDEWRNIYSDPTFDINVLLDKEKGERKQLIDNRLRLTSARTH